MTDDEMSRVNVSSFVEANIFEHVAQQWGSTVTATAVNWVERYLMDVKNDRIFLKQRLTVQFFFSRGEVNDRCVVLFSQMQLMAGDLLHAFVFI